MKKNKIDMKKIIENGGMTLTKTGQEFNANDGYMASLQGFEFKSSDVKEAEKKIYKYIEAIQDKDDAFVGVWVDKEFTYVDISLHILDYLEAVEFARENNQLAIYDLKNNESVYLHYLKYYNLYKIKHNSDGDVVDYVLIKQYNSKNDILSDIDINKKTLNNIIFKKLDDIKQSFKDMVVISDKITEEELIYM